jgi:hypothetical protein
MLALATYLKDHSFDITVVAPKTGPLHRVYRSMGVPVEVAPEYYFHGDTR